MRSIRVPAVAAAIGLLGLAGCANDGSSLLTTASVPAEQQKVAAVDPACLALQNRIALLRSEGTIERVEKAATGKSKTVVIKRSALSKVAELNQANAEFRLRCSKLPEKTTASAAPVKPVASNTAAAAPAAKKN